MYYSAGRKLHKIHEKRAQARGKRKLDNSIKTAQAHVNCLIMQLRNNLTKSHDLETSFALFLFFLWENWRAKFGAVIEFNN